MPLPPSLSGTPPMGSAPISVPTGSPGAAAGGLSKVREALNLLNAAVATLPPGSEPHKAVMAAIQGLVKTVPPSAEVPGVQNTQLQGLMQNAKQNAMLKQVMSSLGAGGSQPGGAPTPPAQPAPPGV